MPPSRKSWVSALPWAFLFGGLALYGAGAAPGLSILDSGEFLGVAATLGVAHPTGYPLYALLGQLATLFPWGGQAFLINLVSAAAAAGAAFFVALAAGELARQLDMDNVARALAIAAAGLLVLAGRTLWSVATMAEVYALNAFFWAALLWAAVRLRRTGAPRQFYLLALIAGLALSNHMTIVLFFPFAALIGWPGRARARQLAPALPLAGAIFLAGFSVNLYIPLRAAGKPAFNWNDPSTLGSTFAHLAAFQYYGNFLGDGVPGVKAALAQYRGAALANVTPAAAFAAAGLVSAFTQRYRLVAAAAIIYYVGYLTYCTVYSIPDIIYYFIPLHLVVVFVAAVGVGVVARAIPARFPSARVAAAAGLAAVVFAAAGWAFVANLPFAHRRGFIFAGTYGRRVLAALPERAIFFPGGDTNTFLTWYNVYAEHLRADVTLVDQVRLVGGGYLTALARRDPDLVVPEEAAVQVFAERAIARGELPAGGIVLSSSDDFILPEIIAGIIADNAAARRMFWGVGDPGKKLQKYFIPYDVVLEVVTEEPPQAEIRRRGEATVDAVTALMAYVEREGPAELRDPFFKQSVAKYYAVLSNHLLARGIYEPQEKLFKSYIRLAPDDANGYRNLGSIYLATGRADEAARSYGRAAALAPRDAALRVRLAQALLAAGRGDEAAALAAKLEEGSPGRSGYVRGVILREEGKLDEALAAFEAATPYYEHDAEFWWEMGLAYGAAGDYRAAAEAYGRSLALDADDARVYTARGVNYLRLGDSTSAAEDFKAAIALNPGNAQAQYNLACLYARDGLAGPALQHLELALRLNPGRYAAMAPGDEDFASCRDSPEFKALVAKYAVAKSAPKT
jgi:tetratricopeptide (TPR) repeat protein